MSHLSNNRTIFFQFVCVWRVVSPLEHHNSSDEKMSNGTSNVKNSSFADAPKPSNIFYVWYTELCRRSNAKPLSIVKPAKPNNSAVLDFVVDRIKMNEWSPILNAMRRDASLHVISIRSRVRCKFLEDVDTEKKAREMKRSFGSLYTPFLLKLLVKSVSSVVSKTQVLTCLELDGLPVTVEYLDTLLEGLRHNRTVKFLSLKHCPIKDSGCQKLCLTLGSTPNVEVLDLSSCELGVPSARCIAKVIMNQQIYRYCECWHNSLRYEEPDAISMIGLKRITLNNNPNIGDEGLEHILDAIEDDLWIKGLDMQCCSITDNMAGRLIDVVDYSKSLEVADFRNNSQLSNVTVEKILCILRSKFGCRSKCKYKWCLSSSTIPRYASSLQDVSEDSRGKILQRSHSTPIKGTTKVVASKQANTWNTFPKSKTSKLAVKDTSKQVTNLNNQLRKEAYLRQQTEKENKILREKLQSIKTELLGESSDDKRMNFVGENLIKNEVKIKIPTVDSNQTNAKVNKPIKENTRPKPNPTAAQAQAQAAPQTQPQLCGDPSTNNVEFVFDVVNKQNREQNQAQNLFENMMHGATDCFHNDDVWGLITYFSADDKPNLSTIDEDGESNFSLVNFIEEVKNQGNVAVEKQKENACVRERCEVQGGNNGGKSQNTNRWVENPNLKDHVRKNGFEKTLVKKVSPVCWIYLL